MKKESIPVRIFRFYLEGFKSMDLGRTLWILILIKLFIMFVILKIFFFPRYLNQFDTNSEKENYVSKELIERALNP
ncbi:MAG: DUF4492 domain-containing protein [Tannerella sp.]|jgi:nitrogen fixation-related uncharacterized protein|nr:DUF4492 domain-containing protein [Tannerella sp.]